MVFNPELRVGVESEIGQFDLRSLSKHRRPKVSARFDPDARVDPSSNLMKKSEKIIESAKEYNKSGKSYLGGYYQEGAPKLVLRDGPRIM